jgi:hypothetical protein
MKLPRTFCHVFLLLATVFLVRAYETETKKSDQLLSNGENPAAFVTNKIESHDVSEKKATAWHAIVCL